jgi:hypothetical protein
VRALIAVVEFPAFIGIVTILVLILGRVAVFMVVAASFGSWFMAHSFLLATTVVIYLAIS